MNQQLTDFNKMLSQAVIEDFGYPNGLNYETEKQLWRLQKYAYLSDMQKDHIETKIKLKNQPLSAVACQTQFLEQIEEFAGSHEAHLAHLIAHDFAFDRFEYKRICMVIQQLMRLHGSNLTEQQLVNCMLVIVTLLNRYGASCELLSNEFLHWQRGSSDDTVKQEYGLGILQYRQMMLRDSLPLVNMNLHQVMFSLNSHRWIHHFQFQLRQLAKLVLPILQDNQLARLFCEDSKEFREKLTENCFQDLTQKLGKTKDQICELIADSTKESSETALQMMDFSEESKISEQEQITLNEVSISVLWLRKITDHSSFQQALIISVRALFLLVKKRDVDKVSALKSESFIAQIFQVLKRTENAEMACLMLNCLQARLLDKHYLEQDMRFYFSQITENFDADEDERVIDQYLADDSYLYQLLKQLCSTRAQLVNIADCSAFEEECVLKADSGPLLESMALNQNVQLAAYNFLSATQESQAQHMRTTKNEFFRHKWFELIMNKDFMQPLSIQPNDKLILNQNFPFLLKLLQSNEKIQKFSEIETQTFLLRIEQQVIFWAKAVNEEVLYLDQLNNLVPLNQVEKIAVLTLFLRFMINKNTSTREMDWGTRIHDTQIIQTFFSSVIPKLLDKSHEQMAALGDESEILEPLVMEYIHLLSEIIDHEIALIRVLLKPGSPQKSQSGVINQLMKLLQVWKPTMSQSNPILQQVDYFKVISKFLGRLSVTEQGSNAVMRLGPGVLRQIFERLGQPATNFFRKFDYKSEFFEIDPTIDRLFHIKVIQDVVREAYIRSIAQAQEVASKIYAQYKNLQDDSSAQHSRLIKQFLTHKMRDEFNQLTELLQFFIIKDNRLRRREAESHNLFQPQQQTIEQTLTKVMSEPGNYDPVLEQRRDLINLLETLSTIEFFTVSIQGVLKILISEQIYVTGDDCLNTKILEQSIKSSITDFAEATNLKECSQLKDLKIQTYETRQKLYKMLMYSQSKLWPMRWENIKNWRTQIAHLLDILKLQTKDWCKIIEHACTRDLNDQKTVSDSAISRIKVIERSFPENDKDVASYLPLAKEVERLLNSGRRHISVIFGQTLHNEEFPLQFIQSLITQAIAAEEKAVRKSSSADLSENQKDILELGRMLAGIAHETNSELSELKGLPLLEQVVNNEALLQILDQFTQNEKLSGISNMGFMLANGIQPLCVLYKSLLKTQNQLFQEQVEEGKDEQQSSKQTLLILRVLVMGQKEVLCKIIYSFMNFNSRSRKFFQQFSMINVEKATQAKYKNPQQLVMQHFDTIFTELLEWDLQEPQLSLATQHALVNADQVIFNALRAFTNQIWKQFSYVDENTYHHHHRRRREGQNSPPLRFEGRQNPRLTENLSQQRGAQESNLSNQKAQLDEDEPMEAEPKPRVMTEEEFNEKVKAYSEINLRTLLKAKSNTVITQEEAIKLLSKQTQLMTNIAESVNDLLNQLCESGDDFQYQTYVIKLILILLPRMSSVQFSSVTFLKRDGGSFKSLVQLTENLIQNQAQKSAQEALHYLCLFVFKIPPELSYVKDEIHGLSLQILESTSIHNLTKDLVLINLYQSMESLKNKQAASQKALEFVVKIQKSGGVVSESLFYQQVLKQALYSEEATRRLLTQTATDVFVTENLFRKDLFKDLNKGKSNPEPSNSVLAQLKYDDLISLLQMITKDPKMISQVLAKSCKVIRDKVKRYEVVKPNDQLIEQALEVQAGREQKFKQIRAGLQVEVESTSELQQLLQNEEQIFKLFIEPSALVLDDAKRLKQFLRRDLVFLAKWTRVFPHLTHQFDDEKFADLFVNKVCLEACQDRYKDALGNEVCTTKVPAYFEKALSDVLTQLLGHNQFSTHGEYKKLYTIKCRIAEYCVNSLKEADPLSLGKLMSSLCILKSLINYKSQHEFNRVLLPPRFYYDTIEFLVTKTDFLELLNQHVKQILKQTTSLAEQKILQIAFEIIKVICAYANTYQQEAKDKKILDLTTSVANADAPIPAVEADSKKEEQPVTSPALAEATVVEQQTNAHVASQADQVMAEGQQNQNQNQEENDSQQPHSQSDHSSQQHGDEEEGEEGDSFGDSQYGQEDEDPDDPNGDSSYYDESEGSFVNISHAFRQQQAQNEAMNNQAPPNDVIRRNNSRRDNMYIGSNRYRHLHMNLSREMARVADQQPRFGDAWTEQEQIAQNIMQQLNDDANDRQSMRDHSFSHCANCFSLGHSTANCPRENAESHHEPLTDYDVNTRTTSEKYNKFTQRFEVLRVIDQSEIKKQLDSNMREFQIQMAPQARRDPTVQFRQLVHSSRSDPVAAGLHSSREAFFQSSYAGQFFRRHMRHEHQLDHDLQNELELQFQDLRNMEPIMRSIIDLSNPIRVREDLHRQPGFMFSERDRGALASDLMSPPSRQLYMMNQMMNGFQNSDRNERQLDFVGEMEHHEIHHRHMENQSQENINSQILRQLEQSGAVQQAQPQLQDQLRLIQDDNQREQDRRSAFLMPPSFFQQAMNPPQRNVDIRFPDFNLPEEVLRNFPGQRQQNQPAQQPAEPRPNQNGNQEQEQPARYAPLGSPFEISNQSNSFSAELAVPPVIPRQDAVILGSPIQHVEPSAENAPRGSQDDNQNDAGQQEQEAEIANVEHESSSSSQQEAVVEERPEAAEEVVYGYPVSVLRENNVDPDILSELPDDVRMELLSTINWMARPAQNPVPPVAEQVIVEQPAQEQGGGSFSSSSPQVQSLNNNDAVPIARSPSEPRVEQPAPQVESQNQPVQQQPQHEEVKDIGIDQDFLANLPEDIRQEILGNERLLNQNLGRQQNIDPPRQPVAQQNGGDLDIANFIAAQSDPNLRQDILLNLDPQDWAVLPTNLREEAERLAQNQRIERMNQGRAIRELFDEQDPVNALAAGVAAAREPGQPNMFRDPRSPRAAGRQIGIFPRIGGHYAPDPLVNPFMQEERWGAGHRFGLFGGRMPHQHQMPKTVQELERYFLPLDKLFFKQFNNDELFMIKPERVFGSFIDKSLGVSCSESLLKPMLEVLLQMCVYDKELLKTNNIKTKFNLLQVMVQLTFVNKDLIAILIDSVFEYYIQTWKKLTDPSVENNENHEIQMLILINILRVWMQKHKKFGHHLLQDFLYQKGKNSKLDLILDHLQQLHSGETQLRNSEFQSPLSRNLQHLVHDIFLQNLPDCYISKAKASQILEDTIKQLCEVFMFQYNNQALSQMIGKALSKILKAKAQASSCPSQLLKNFQGKQIEAQTKLVQSLKQINLQTLQEEAEKQEQNEQEEDVEMDDGSLSLQYQLSQHSQQQKDVQQIETKTKTVIQSSLLQTLEDSLKAMQRDLLFLRQITSLLELLGDPQSKDSSLNQGSLHTYKTQVSVLNQLLATFKNYKNIQQSLLVQLKQHVSCLFELNFAELKVNTRGVESQCKQACQVKMKPLKQENIVEQSKKEKLANAIFKSYTKMSDQLYEFCKFCLINKDLINRMINLPAAKDQHSGSNADQQCTMTLTTFTKTMPNILQFKQKRSHFRKELDRSKREQRHSSLRVSVKRKDIFMEAYAQLGHKTAHELRGELKIEYVGEKGLDAGGLTRDFYIELSRAMFNPDYSLFTLSSNGVSYYPNSKSYVNPEHLNYFKFIGRMIGKALFDGHLLDCYFSKPLYKMMIGDELCFEDQQDIDEDTYRGYQWTLKNDPSDYGLYFCIDVDYFGQNQSKELIANGQDIVVTNENKLDYLEKLSYYKLYTNIKEQVDAFLKGFHELIPRNLVQIFNHHELELLLSGLPDFNLNDLRRNTDYAGGYKEDSDQVRWLWQILAQFTKEEISRFLQFVTGSSRIPLEGFKALQGMRGPQNFTIQCDKNTDKLPTGHTCFNRLDVPLYPTKQVLKEKLMYAINETSGFGFA